MGSLILGPHGAGEHHHVRSKEAYVLFVSTDRRPEYELAARVHLFGLKRDPIVCDPTRDVVIITIPQVPSELEDQFRAEGALVERHPLVTGPPSPYNPDGPHRRKDQYTKLHILNMAQYEGPALMDKYFAPDGDHPWELLGSRWTVCYPYQADIDYRVAALHDKGWSHGDGYYEVPREVSELWRERLGRMEGYYLTHAGLGDLGRSDD